ncbi:MAG: twin-arginine translocase TatA/TatE family subunit [Actinomycetota bacterium]|nr:twin-arginine translocase TatA/TatE family subunit [Actinomycetota bacterium]
MGNLDPTKIAIVLIVALVVLGPEKLPGFTKQLGAWWGEFQRVRARLQAEINGAVNQINSVASPLTENFKAASGTGGILPSIFSVDNSKKSESAVTPPFPKEQGRSSESRKASERQGKEGWGNSEGESGYGHGDPRLN